MVVACQVAVACSFIAVTVSGRSLRADPWEGATDYMAQYTFDASKDASIEETETFAPKTPSSGIEPSSASSSADSWLKSPTTNKLSADVAAWSSPSSTDSWLRAPADDTLSLDVAPTSSANTMGAVPRSPVDASSNPAPGANAWLKQSTDSWAFAVPHAVPDATDVGSSNDGSIPHEAVTEQRGASIDFNAELRGTDEPPTNAWADAQPRAAVQQDASTVGQDQTQSQAAEGRGSIGDDASEGASEDTNGGAAVHVHAGGSIGGLFDGGEDRGSQGGGEGTSQGAAKTDAPNHAGGAVVNVRLDSELQESR